ncbi:MAG: RHS repeat domain-containing protein, partial [Chloroflexota bacterium]
MTNVSYSYDSVASGNYGKGKRTGMTDDPGSAAFTYDAIGRIIKEDKTIDSTVYTTQYTYDSADRLTNVRYPDGENVTQTYNGRGLPYSLY